MKIKSIEILNYRNINACNIAFNGDINYIIGEKNIGKSNLLVILDTPGEGVNHNGGQIAAPTAGKMLSEILPYMNIETGNKDSENNSNISEKDLY